MSGEHAFYVDVQVIPEHREAFDQHMVAHSRRTLAARTSATSPAARPKEGLLVYGGVQGEGAGGVSAQEEGCLEFEVYVHRNDPNRYALYEVYADDAAL